MEDVAPDLVAPAGLDVLPAELPGLRLALLEGPLQEPCREDLDGRLLVLGLAPLVLALGDDPGRQVGQADGGIGLVDVLAAGALRTEGVDPDLVPVELDLGGVLDLGQDLDEGERRLAALLGVVGADPHEPVDPALRPEPAVRPPAVDRHGDALEAGLLALLLVEDLGPEAMALGPAQVHPEEHLGPVRGLRAARAGADRQERVAIVVLAREEEGRPLAGEVGLEGGGLTIELGGQLDIVGLGHELDHGLEIGSPGEKAAPQVDLPAQAVGLAEDLLGRALVVPEAGLLGQRLELGDPRFACGEVKDAPMSTGSAPPGPGRRRGPSVPDLEVLEQDRTELDESEGRLAPGDDGVHAGTVAVVGTDAAVAVAVEGGGVAAGPAISLTGDQVNEARFLGLLHKTLTSHHGHGGLGAGGCRWDATSRAREVAAKYRCERSDRQGVRRIFREIRAGISGWPDRLIRRARGPPRRRGDRRRGSTRRGLPARGTLPRPASQGSSRSGCWRSASPRPRCPRRWRSGELAACASDRSRRRRSRGPRPA